MSNNSSISFNMLSNFAVRDESGKLDFDATMAAFAARLTDYEAAVGMETEQIANAVHSVFNKFPSINLTMDAIVSFALPDLNPTPDNHTILSARIKDYIRDNADRPAVLDEVTKATITPAEAPRTRLFAIAKGKGGGVRSWNHTPIKPE